MFYRYNLYQKIKSFKVNDIKNIILDSLYINNNKMDNEIIEDYIKTNVNLYKQKMPTGTIYNYIVDRIGNTHELVPVGYDTISFPYDSTINRGVISIATLSINDGSGLDSGYMTSECCKSLYNLIVNILIRLKYESGIRLNGSSLKLRCHMNYGAEPEAGHIFFKKNPPNFMALKRNVTRGLMDISMIKNVMR